MTIALEFTDFVKNIVVMAEFNSLFLPSDLSHRHPGLTPAIATVCHHDNPQTHDRTSHDESIARSVCLFVG